MLSLDAAKAKLNITWDDEITDRRVQDIIDDLHPKVCHTLGLPEDFDFGEPGAERMLFLNAVFYEWNDAFDDFEGNYLEEIMQIRNKHEVEEYRSKNAETQAPDV